jgi:hypothetical protein
VLRGIEHRIESLFEGVFGRAFRSHVQPVEIARKLVKEMDDHRSVSVSRVYVPNEYVLYLAPRDREQFRGYETSLLVELSDYLAEHARREGYTLLSPPRVVLEEDDDLSVGEFGIATRLVQAPPLAQHPVAPPPEPAGLPGEPLADVPPAPAPPAGPPAEQSPAPPPGAPVVASATVPEPPPVVASPDPPAPPVVDSGGTRVFEPEPADVTSVVPPPAAAPSPPRAVLVSGERRFALADGVAVVGRTKECGVAILDDPSVSRRHAEIRVDTGEYWIIDLGSTNGTEVNGKRVSRLRLGTGDRITVGQTTLTFERLA